MFNTICVVQYFLYNRFLYDIPCTPIPCTIVYVYNVMYKIFLYNIFGATFPVQFLKYNRSCTTFVDQSFLYSLFSVQQLSAQHCQYNLSCTKFSCTTFVYSISLYSNLCTLCSIQALPVQSFCTSLSGTIFRARYVLYIFLHNSSRAIFSCTLFSAQHFPYIFLLYNISRATIPCTKLYVQPFLYNISGDIFPT